MEISDIMVACSLNSSVPYNVYNADSTQNAHKQFNPFDFFLLAQANLISNGSTLKPKTNKNWVNYAAAPCGAKILGTNNEAINPAFLLTENKDQYMINPCKVKKW